MQRYSDTVNIINREDKKRSYETMYYPKFPYNSEDIYIISKRSDRMDLLAHQHYADPRLWWVIARANSFPYGTISIPAGVRVRIPWPLTAYDAFLKLQEVQF